MTADRVFEDRPHRPAAIGIERVPGREVDRVRVVDRPPGREPLAPIVRREGDEVRHLLAAGIDDLQALAVRHDEPGARLRLEVKIGVARSSRHPHGLRAMEGQRHWPFVVSRPEYCRASERSPKSARLGLRLPCSATSRSRMRSRRRSKCPSRRRRSNCACGLKTSAGQANRRASRELSRVQPDDEERAARRS